jgi:hypothetical protein
MSGENSGAEAGAPLFFYVCVSQSPPLALEVTGDLDKEDRRVGGRDNDLGGAYGMRRRDRRATTRGGVFGQPFPFYLRQDQSHAGARLGWPDVPPKRRPASAGRHPDSVGAGRAS